MKFYSFAGNDKIKERLSFLAESGRFPHAVILEGEAGLGKRTLAREIALNLLCRNVDDRPCRKCAQCSKVLKGIHPDVTEYEPEGATAVFKVDKVREIRDDAFVQPNEADYKIYILAGAERMNESAQNALLKVLEEPPEYAVFILTATSKSAMLETVLSRSVVFTLEGVEPRTAAEYICSVNENTDYDEALKAAQIWDGNIGKAIESLNDGMFAKNSSVTVSLAEALLSDNEYELLKICSVFDRDKDMLISAMTLLKAVFRDALVYPYGGVTSGQEETVKKLSSKLSTGKLLKLVEVCENIKSLAQKNSNNAILITKVCYDLRRAVSR